MSLRIGDDAPNFSAQTTEGEIDFYQWLGNSWGIIYSHPADYTPVCTTELGRTAQLKDEFAARDTKVIAVSVDDLHRIMAGLKISTKHRIARLISHSLPIMTERLPHFII